MSRIGKAPVIIPTGANVAINGHTVIVKGPKGQLSQTIDPDISVSIEGNTVLVTRPTDQKRHRALHGLYRTLIHNMVQGVTAGYEKKNGNDRCRIQV